MNGTKNLCVEICGDGIVVGWEICDDGIRLNNKGCLPNCTGSIPGWSCTPGDNITASSCSEICDDGLIVGVETCDDFNQFGSNESSTNPWGCNSNCIGEVVGWNCTLRSGTWSNCFEICGDGIIVGRETCDDGNLTDNEGCANNCKETLTGWGCTGSNVSFPSVCSEVCDDGYIVGNETCDDHYQFGSSPLWDDWGCKNDCWGVNDGWNCSQVFGNTSFCFEICGDKLIVGTEVCEDEDLKDGKGCQPDCKGIIPGWDCQQTSNTYLSCTEICGDGLLVGIETCDDGSFDLLGCKDTCVGARKGWRCIGAPNSTKSS